MFCHVNPLWIDEIIRLAYKDQDTKDVKSKVKIGKLTKSSMKTRQFIFFTQLFGRVQIAQDIFGQFGLPNISVEK